MTLKFNACLTTSHNSLKFPYMLSLQKLSNIHSPLGFHCISSYHGDDSTIVRELEEMLRLSKSQGSWGSKMWDMFWHFYLVLEVNI